MSRRERYLVFTNAYPYPDLPYYGVFVADQVREWRRNGVEAEVFFINGRRSRWNYLSGALAFAWKMLREGQSYDAIVVHHSYCCLFAWLVRPRGVPIVYQVHEGTIHFSRLHRILVRGAVRLADRVVYVARTIPEGLHVPADDCTIIACGIDLTLFCPRPKDDARRALAWDPAARVVLYAAKERVGYERFDLVRDAVDRLRRDKRTVRLVRLEGLRREEVPARLNAADVLVLASWGEGSPKIVKEALACNRPVVALRVGSVPDLLSGVASGFLSDDDAESLAAQLEKALALNGVGCGREKAAGFSVEATSLAFLDVCRDAARRRGGRMERL